MAKAVNIGSLVKESLDLLEPEQTVAVHATSIEAVIAMLGKSRLMVEPFSYVPNKLHEDYLFFTPHVKHFESHPLAKVLLVGFMSSYSWEKTLRQGAGPGERVAQCHYLTSQFGYYDVNFLDLPFYTGQDFPSPSAYTQELRYMNDLIKSMEPKGFSRERCLEILAEANRRKGVLLGVGSSIFEFRIEEGKDDPEGEVCIFLPAGLDLKYFNSIVPIGSIEKRMLNDYLVQRNSGNSEC